MIRDGRVPDRVGARLPRMRGDDPEPVMQGNSEMLFAPHARG